MLEDDEIEGIKIAPGPTKERLSERQLVDYASYREDMIRWMLNFGKDPDQVKGYARATVDKRAIRIDLFYRWVWDEEGGYTTRVTTEHADGYQKELAYADYTDKYKAGVTDAVKTLFRWRAREHGGEEWEPEFSFSPNNDASNPREFLSSEERQKIREAALEYGSIPTYSNLTADERDKWKTYLAQRLKKPKRDVSRNDWDKANSWKIPSMVWASLDAGLRPIEVKRATLNWIDLENEVLRIPKEESSKNTDNWVVALSTRTVNALERWLEQRSNYPKYEGEDTIWLTRDGNPYKSQSLKYVLNRLCEIANIETENRKMSWYAIRHSVGTGMANERGLAAAQQQLRHKSQKTTMKYDQAPVEERKEALNKMG